MRFRSRIRYYGAAFQGNASVGWRAIPSAVGLVVTLIQTRSLRLNTAARSLCADVRRFLQFINADKVLDTHGGHQQKCCVGAKTAYIEPGSPVKNAPLPCKYPRIVEFLPELPKTGAGKIVRQALLNRDQGKRGLAFAPSVVG